MSLLLHACHQARFLSVLVKVFEHEGFTFDRQRGDHLIYIKPEIKRVHLLRLPVNPGVQQIRVTRSHAFPFKGLPGFGLDKECM